MKNNKTVLFVCTYADFLVSFELGNIKTYISKGYEVHCASNIEKKEYNRNIDTLIALGVKIHHVDFPRKPTSLLFFKSYKQIKKIIKEEKIMVLDTHNPVSSVISRLAAKKAGIKTVIYTAHGLSFWKGAPISKRLIFKPIEKKLAKYTDVLICINNEDYNYAKKHFKVRKSIEYIPGIGINCNKIHNAPENISFRKDYNIPKEAFLLVSVGELIPRKNHILVIKALANLIKDSDIYYAMIGQGYLTDELKLKAKKYGLEKRVKFVGFRTDIYSILKTANAFVFPSRAEGLPVALMEAMASPVICIASDIRGNHDLVDNQNGFLFKDNNQKELERDIVKAVQLSEEEKENKLHLSLETIKNCDRNVVQTKMHAIYDELLKY